MLRSEFRFPTNRWPLRLVPVLLGEAFLGFLAIIAAALTLFPMLFDPGEATLNGIESAQWAIIAWFGLEYLVALASAPSKRLFLSDAWRWIDLATIVVPLASLLPSVSHLVRSSPVLRLVRLARLLTLGVRATGIVVRDQQRKTSAANASGPVHITRRGTAQARPAAPVSRDELLQWLGAGSPGWFHVSNPTPDDARVIAAAAGLPAEFLDVHLLAATHPHVTAASDCLAVFVWTPQLDATDGAVERSGLLVLAWSGRVLSLSRGRRTAATAISLPENGPGPFPLRVLGTVLQAVVNDNETLVTSFEQQLGALEDLPLRESRPEFFEQTFRLKKQLSAAQWDLWRLKSVLGQLAHRTTLIPGVQDASATFAPLATTADYLYETVVNTREDVMAVIDLHLNVVSFDMNRVMRVLAVVSVLGLIPAVIGGLLGMNLIDNPWHFTLPQVSFVVVFGMVVGLYFFFVKGWLK